MSTMHQAFERFLLSHVFDFHHGVVGSICPNCVLLPTLETPWMPEVFSFASRFFVLRKSEKEQTLARAIWLAQLNRKISFHLPRVWPVRLAY